MKKSILLFLSLFFTPNFCMKNETGKDNFFDIPEYVISAPFPEEENIEKPEEKSRKISDFYKKPEKESSKSNNHGALKKILVWFLNLLGLL